MFKFREIKAKATSFLDDYKQKEPASYAAAQQAIGGLLILDGLVGIENPFGGKKRPGIFGALVGVVVGVVFVVIGFFGAGWFGLNDLTAQTTATVVSVGAPSATTRNSDGSTSGGSCSMTARYTVNGKEYTTTSSMSSSSYCGNSVGSNVSINYNPNNPGKWATNVGTVKKVIKIFGYVGIVAIVVSLFTFTIRLLSIIFGWKILKSGRALAKTLPAGTNLETAIKETREAFSRTLFGNNTASPASTLSNAIQEVVDHEKTPPTPPSTPAA